MSAPRMMMLALARTRRWDEAEVTDVLLRYIESSRQRDEDFMVWLAQYLTGEAEGVYDDDGGREEIR